MNKPYIIPVLRSRRWEASLIHHDDDGLLPQMPQDITVKWRELEELDLADETMLRPDLPTYVTTVTIVSTVTTVTKFLELLMSSSKSLNFSSNFDHQTKFQKASNKQFIKTLSTNVITYGSNSSRKKVCRIMTQWPGI